MCVFSSLTDLRGVAPADAHQHRQHARRAQQLRPSVRLGSGLPRRYVLSGIHARCGLSHAHQQHMLLVRAMRHEHIMLLVRAMRHEHIVEGASV
jgi:hypothetical protein